jgi:hypothetical protein
VCRNAAITPTGYDCNVCRNAAMSETQWMWSISLGAVELDVDVGVAG